MSKSSLSRSPGAVMDKKSSKSQRTELVHKLREDNGSWRKPGQAGSGGVVRRGAGALQGALAGRASSSAASVCLLGSGRAVPPAHLSQFTRELYCPVMSMPADMEHISFKRATTAAYHPDAPLPSSVRPGNPRPPQRCAGEQICSPALHLGAPASFITPGCQQPAALSGAGSKRQLPGG